MVLLAVGSISLGLQQQVLVLLVGAGHALQLLLLSAHELFFFFHLLFSLLYFGRNYLLYLYSL